MAHGTWHMGSKYLALIALTACIASPAVASVYSPDPPLVLDKAINVTSGMRISGSTSWASGYLVDSNGVRQFIYSATYTWDRTNTDNYTHVGYSVNVSATDPVAGSGVYVYFPTTATVRWLSEESIPNPKGPGNS